MIFFLVGDVVLVDVCIIYVDDLLVNEFVLMGNEVNIEKFESCYYFECKWFILLKWMKDYNLFEFENVCFKGLYIVSGNVKVIVVFIGKNMYLGILYICCSRMF